MTHRGPAYFAFRSAVMGAVPWRVALATFYNFSPRAVRAMTGVWDAASPEQWQAARFVGGAPPAGHGPHRYVITVHALGIEDIGIAADSTPAFLGFTMASHILARATLTGTAEIPAG